MEQFNRVIGSIYDAAISPPLWNKALEEICIYTSSAAGTLASVDLSTGNEKTMVIHGISNYFDNLYKETYHCTDLFIHPLMLRPIGEPATSSELVDEKELLNSRIYREWAAPQGFRDTLMTMLGRNQAHLAFLGLTRKLEQTRYTSKDVENIRYIIPHLQKALYISDIVGQKASDTKDFSEVIDALNVAIFIVDANARLRHRNAAADRILEEKSSVKLSDVYLCGPDGVRLTKSSLVELPNRLKEIDTFVLPLVTKSSDQLQRFALFLRPTESVGPLAPEFWARKFNLTGSELRILVGLTEGLTPKQIADRYGIARTTVKTHLLNVFRKTETKRQSDLIRVALSALPPAALASKDSRT
jgi:DNA-binding CsgD family transcriptional regulator/PAS domain-containing protein